MFSIGNYKHIDGANISHLRIAEIRKRQGTEADIIILGRIYLAHTCT